MTDSNMKRKAEVPLTEEIILSPTSRKICDLKVWLIRERSLSQQKLGPQGNGHTDEKTVRGMVDKMV